MKKIPVFFMAEMVADSESYSPSSLKPGFLAERLEKCKSVSITGFEPATREELILSHDPEYVDEVLSLKKSNGFGNKSAKIRDALPFIVGAEIAAARNAAKTQSLTWALCSGFHHAHYDSGGGFCTFEGLTIAAQIAIEEKRCDEVIIIDGDAHYGDGCVDIIKHKSLSAKIHYIHIGGRPDYKESVQQVFDENEKSGLVLFQDGMDSYYLDPIGGSLTYAQMIERTSFITNLCRKSNRGLAINLAGGYFRFKHASVENELEPVLTGHMNDIKASAEIFGLSLPEFEYVNNGIWETDRK